MERASLFDVLVKQANLEAGRTAYLPQGEIDRIRALGDGLASIVIDKPHHLNTDRVGVGPAPFHYFRPPTRKQVSPAQ